MIRLAVLAALLTPALAQDSALPPGFVRLADIAPDIRQEMRYASSENFTGRPVPGYGAPECWLRREAAEALGRVGQSLSQAGWRLVAYDCYRPQRAVSAFVSWARRPGDESRKAEYYPAIDKQRLFALGYIASASSHSKGTAIDAGAERRDGTALDFGTPFDFFDARSGAGHAAISAEATANRRRLTVAFAAQGFAGYAREWWHFGFRASGPAYDVPITRR